MRALCRYGVVGLLWIGAAWGALAAQERTPVVMDEVRVPDSLGVNIHFTDPRPGEMAMLAEAGFKWVRMDFGWAHTEREKGRYDFSAFDRLLAALEPHGIRALFILDYANKLYDGGVSPYTEEGRQAFARWAAAAVAHFKDRGILWEMYNEPNIQFWKPKPDVNKYIPLALAVGKAIRQAAPGEQYTGPATSQIDLKFLEACFKAGLLEYWSAVSVHPYRNKLPETVIEEYARLRKMIDQYAPQGKRIPILSGEWGYTVEKERTPEIQGKFLARQFLVNLMSGVPLSIWYDWHDDGLDPKEREHHFGTVLHKYYEGRTPVYDPKPAWYAARTLATVLKDCRFAERLAVGAPEDFVLVFKNGSERRLAAWTTAAQPRRLMLPGLQGDWHAIDHLGKTAVTLKAGAGGLNLELSDQPQYLIEKNKMESGCPMAQGGCCATAGGQCPLPRGAFTERIENWRKYFRGPVWEKAFTTLEQLAPDAPVGETRIQGDDIRLLVSSYNTKPAGEATLESHRQYIDVQMVLEGHETFCWLPLATLTPKQPYDPARDLIIYDNRVTPLGRLDARPGFFAVFTPQDAHMTQIFPAGTTTPGADRKAVVKIRVGALQAAK